MVVEEAGEGAVLTTEVTVQVEAVTEIIAPVQIEAFEHGLAVAGAGLGAEVGAGAGVGAGVGVIAEAGAGPAAGVLGTIGAAAEVLGAIGVAAAVGAPEKKDDVSPSLIKWKCQLLNLALNPTHLMSPKSHRTLVSSGQRMWISPRSLIALILIPSSLHLTIQVHQLLNLKV